MNRFYGFLAACLMAVSLSYSVHASMRVNPMIVNMTPSGRGTQATVQITNVTDLQLPVEVTVVKRILVDEKEVLVPADDDFVVFPPQFNLEPGATQTLRLQWVAGDVPTTSESYYVYATQIPVPLNDGESGVVINYQFGISLQMVPPGVDSHVIVEKIVSGEDKDGSKGFEISVKNAGTKYARMSEHSLSLKTEVETREWNIDELKANTGVGFMLPGEKRTFFIAYDLDLGAAPLAELHSRAQQK